MSIEVVVEVVEWSTGRVVRSFPVRGAATPEDRSVDRAIRGLLINMDTERFGARAVIASFPPCPECGEPAGGHLVICSRVNDV